MPPLISNRSIWEHLRMGDAVCCPVNTVVKGNGELVMGAGLAKAMAEMLPRLPGIFGLLFAERPGVFLVQATNRSAQLYSVVSFPTKDDWRAPSDLELIRRSATSLVEMKEFSRSQMRCYVPKVGCGLGGLDWEFQVKPILMETLDERFLIPS